MSWAKLDDQFHAHRKAKIAWRGHPRALGMHLLAISYCAGQLTDGLVDDEFVEEKIPAARERNAVTEALVAAGLWGREGDGWRINDWLDFNPSREEVLNRRRKDSERKARKDSKRNPSGIQAESNGIPSDPSRVRAFPDPTRPDQSQIPPSPPRGGRERDRLEHGLQFNSWCAGHFPGVQPSLVSFCVGLLQDRHIEPTADALRPVIDNGGVIPSKEAA